MKILETLMRSVRPPSSLETPTTIRSPSMIHTIKGRLFALLGVLGTLLVGSAALSNYALYRDFRGLESIYADRVMPLSQFGAMRDGEGISGF